MDDDADRDAFVGLLDELVQRTGWEMFSWVLMSNHYHLVFKTPEANLVAGMKWLQNTWTKRFNARHRLWGPVFGDRYKAVLVEENEHLSCLIDYVHLNPVRAGLIRGKMELPDYRWSSLGLGARLEKLVMLGKYPTRLYGEVEYNFADDAIGPEVTYRFNIAPLLPMK